MKNNKLIKNIIQLCTKLENYCEGFDENSKGELISTKLRILIEIDECNKISPCMLVEKIGLAKSNIALICNGMVKDNLLSKQKDEIDNRVVFYSLTDQGKKELNESLKKLEFNFERQLAYKKNMKEIENLIDKLKKEIE